jgi:hypothetical protein
MADVKGHMTVCPFFFLCEPMPITRSVEQPIDRFAKTLGLLLTELKDPPPFRPSLIDDRSPASHQSSRSQ